MTRKILIALVFLLPACSASQVNDAKSPDGQNSLNTWLQFVDKNLTPIPIETDEKNYEGKGLPFPDPIYIEYRHVSGVIFGEISSEKFYWHSVTRKKKVALQGWAWLNNHLLLERLNASDIASVFTLNLTRIGDALARAASQDSNAQPGVNIDPPTTRIARLATLSAKSAGQTIQFRGIGFTGFLDVSTGERLALIYVDRPCQITGTVHQDWNDDYDHHVDITSAGLHWICFKKEGDARYRVERCEPQGDIATYIRIGGFDLELVSEEKASPE